MFSLTEQLEARRLLSAFGSVNANGTLSVVGGSKNDTIIVQFSGSKVQAIVNGQTESFNKSAVKRVWVEAFGGNDSIANKTNLPSTLIGDAGNDTIVGGSADDEIDAGSGNDHFDGGLGTNIIHEGTGTDAFDYSSETGSTFDINNINQFSALEVTRNSGAGVDLADEQTNLDTLIATPGNDHVTFFLDDDPDFHFYLGAGNDVFGPDTGSGAAASVDAGAGNDVINFNYDAPVFSVMGGSGNDTINDDSGYPSETIDGGSGFDVLTIDPDVPVSSAPVVERTVPPGIESYTLGVMNDLIIHGNDLDNIINVGAANVTVYGNGGNDQIHASAFNDDPDFAGAGHVSLDGGAGNDYLHASAVLDSTIKGGDGSDTLVGDGNFGSQLAAAHPNIVYIGGGGSDTADFSAQTDDLHITLDNIANDGASGEASNVMSDVETIIGGSGNDFLQGNPSNNDLIGGVGDDTLWGGSGRDTLEGDAGHDQLHGQDGDDLLLGKDGQTDTLDGGNGNDTAQRDNSASVKDLVLDVEHVS